MDSKLGTLVTVGFQLCFFFGGLFSFKALRKLQAAGRGTECERISVRPGKGIL